MLDHGMMTRLEKVGESLLDIKEIRDILTPQEEKELSMFWSLLIYMISS